MADMVAPFHSYQSLTQHFAEEDRCARFLHVAPELAPIFRRYMAADHSPGVAFGVVVDGELVYGEGIGVRDVASLAPVAADTVFRIASMTKSFVALAILQLRDEGKLRLDDPAVVHCPELASLVYPTRDSHTITLRDLLTMGAGWPQDDPWADRQVYLDDAALSALLQTGVIFANTPGVAFEYSNLGYMVLGRVITHVAGIPAIEYINREILRPLGMDSTCWKPDDVAPEQLARGYQWRAGEWIEEPLLPSGGDVAGFGGIFSSVHDLARWVGLFQSAWPARDEPDDGLLKRSSLREMQQGARIREVDIATAAIDRPVTALFRCYAMGLVETRNGRWTAVGHSGGLPGFGSHMRWAPEYGVGIIGLANSTYADMHEACRHALDLLIDQSGVLPRRWVPTQALAAARDAMNDLLLGWDDEVADALFASNFFQDEPRELWRARLSALHNRHGTLKPDGDFEIENRLRGCWRVAGERGWCDISLTMTPTVPPRVQEMEILSTLPPSPAMLAAGQKLAALITHPTRRALARIVAPAAERERVWDQVRMANILYGPVTLGETVAGDGDAWAILCFTGAKGAVEAELMVDADRERFTKIVLRPVCN